MNSPKAFLVSVALGFVLCASFGRYASHQPTYSNVTRFNQFLNPVSYFYPTPGQIKATILSKLKNGQTLVLIGGNSNFFGAAQNEDSLWSLYLQKELGDKYLVVNLATYGSYSADFAGVIFRIFRASHPDTIFVVNTYAYQRASIDGAEDARVFNYFFWDAHYKDLLPPDPAIEFFLADRKSSAFARSDIELHIGSYLDSIFYARDLWSYVGYHWLFTVWTPKTSAKFTQARKLWTVPPDAPSTFAKRIERTPTAAAMEHLIPCLKLSDVGTNGQLIKNAGHWADWRESYEKVFSRDQRDKIIVAVLWNNPFFIKKLPRVDKERYEFGLLAAAEELHQLGYKALSVGRDFDPEDFETVTHFVESGGRKIASAIAAEIAQMKPR